IPVQEQGCVVNPSGTVGPNQDPMVRTQGSMDIFANCLRIALQVTNQQDKEVGVPNDRQAEFYMSVLIQSIRLVQLCRHTHQEGYRAHFVQLLQRTMR
ncbi:hypothetical protein scyTo_0017871, partial [Scyliorhinus torazame]|nr:hypothetical protein [Scyliorhinus torazame]